MKHANKFLKVTIILFIAIISFSCAKDEDPYADYTPEREASLIVEWVDAMKKNNKTVLVSPTGLNYIMEKEGTGEKVSVGKTITVKYTGIFLDGSVFDSSTYYGDGTYVYIHKDTDLTKRMIQGWEEGIELLSKGSTAAFLIPSAKAYGSKGTGPIPPYTPLVFIIEVIDIK